MKPKPKGVLHDHIDGSTAVPMIIDDLYTMADAKFPFENRAKWLKYMRDVTIPIPERFETITSVLQTREALEHLAYTYGKVRARKGYTYVEGKFAPQYSLRRSLSMWDVTTAIMQGLHRAERDFSIRIFPHVCIGRETTVEVGEVIADIAIAYAGEMALDLACDESGNPPEKHLPAYRKTFGTKVKRDCHAGEFADGAVGSPERNAQLIKNMLTAVIDLKCHGIGHAIPLNGVPDLIKLIVDRGVRVSGCPLSNLTSGFISHVRELGIDQLLDAGVIYTLNADDDLFLPPMMDVLDQCEEAYTFTRTQKTALEKNVFRGAWGLGT